MKTKLVEDKGLRARLWEHVVLFIRDLWDSHVLFIRDLWDPRVHFIRDLWDSRVHFIRDRWDCQVLFIRDLWNYRVLFIRDLWDSRSEQLLLFLQHEELPGWTVTTHLPFTSPLMPPPTPLDFLGPP